MPSDGFAQPHVHDDRCNAAACSGNRPADECRCLTTHVAPVHLHASCRLRTTLNLVGACQLTSSSFEERHTGKPCAMFTGDMFASVVFERTGRLVESWDL